MRNNTHNRHGNTRCQKKNPHQETQGLLSLSSFFRTFSSPYNLHILFAKKTLRRRRRASWASPHLLSCSWFLPPWHLRPRFVVVTTFFYPLSLCSPLVLLNKQCSWSSSDGTQRPSRESERQFEAKVEDFFRSTTFSYRPPIHKIQNTHEVRRLVGAPMKSSFQGGHVCWLWTAGIYYLR